MVYSAIGDFLMTDHPLVERSSRPNRRLPRRSQRKAGAQMERNDMVSPEQSTQSEICNPKSEIGAGQPFSSGQYAVSPNESWKQ